MRISEQRYNRDRRALDLAARLVEFEVRTGTIRQLTGLSEGRIRSLYRACGADGRPVGRPRHRGAPPHSVSSLLAKSRAKDEVSALLALCQLMGVMAKVRQPDADRTMSRLTRAERVCDAFWTFRYLLPEATIGFEHMLLLLGAAEKGEEIGIAECGACRAFLVVDALAAYSRLCSGCDSGSVDLRSSAEQVRYRCVAEEAAAYN